MSEDQTIFRAHRTERDRWTNVLNETIRDGRMSFRATGLLIYLLSLPPDWRANQQHISTVKKEGRDAVISAWGELRDLGYITKEIVRERGKIVATVWHIYETCRNPEKPETDEPETVLPETENPILRTTEKEETPRKRTKYPKAPGGGDDAGFEAFYAEYPNKKKKPNALKAWVKNGCSSLAEEIMLALSLQKTWPQWLKKDGAFIPHPATWLNGHEWKDEAPTVEKQQSKNGFSFV